MTIDEIRAALETRRLPAVAEIIGVSHSALWRFCAGVTKRPSSEMVDALRAYLEGGK